MILQYPNKLLSTKCREMALPEEEGLARNVGEALMEALKDTKRRSVGLSANQIGMLYRVFVMDVKFLKVKAKSIFVNPEIIWESMLLHDSNEECMSLPKHVKAKIARPWQVKLRYQTPSGKVREVDLEGLAARCACHELDHLDGISILQRAEMQRKLSA